MISVIISTYNSEEFLKESISSILKQTYKNFELVIVNDGSTDNSRKIIEKYQQADDRIILIDNQTNLGRPKARNKALKIAKGKYIAILDADDIALPERLEIQYNHMEKYKEIFLLGSSAINITHDGKYVNITKVPLSFNKIANKLPKKNCIIHPTVMYRNTGEFFYREKFPYAQDYDLYLRILSDGQKLENLKKPLIKYRLSHSAVSWDKAAHQRLFADKAKEFYYQRITKGKDNYSDFDPKTILEIDVDSSENKVVLLQEVKSSFKLNNFKRTRNFSKKFFNKYGYLNSVFFYYLLTFCGKKFVNILRRLLSR